MSCSVDGDLIIVDCTPENQLYMDRPTSRLLSLKDVRGVNTGIKTCAIKYSSVNNPGAWWGPVVVYPDRTCLEANK